MKYFKLFYYYSNINQREAYAITYITFMKTLKQLSKVTIA